MSAANINRVIITGNLTKDPELRAISSGVEVCDLRVAVNARRKKGEEWVDVPNYFDVAVWGKRGKLCDDFLAKGSGVAIDGRLEWREWKGRDEKNHQSVQIVADGIQFIGPKREKAGTSSGAEDMPESANPTDDVPADSSGFENPVPVAAGAGASDDDIPF